ncbi:MAG TPA: tetratricopeptide repeat protein [Pyrinomonadaceae bacterium]|jgi:tetratricopeptide (TPR) repeat protein
MDSFTYFLSYAGMFLYAFISTDLSKESSESWIKSTLGGLPTEIVGSAVDRTYELVKNKLKERFPKIIRDNKKTLFKSVRRSQLKAVRDVCNVYRDEIKGTKSEKNNLEYIKRIEDYLKSEESKLTQGDFIDINLSDADIRRITSSETLPQSSQIDTSNALIKELPKYNILPQRFIQILQNGWQQHGLNHSLLERFEVYFNAELVNPEVANVLFKNALSGIQISLDELLEGQTNQAEKISELKDVFEKRADELKNLGYRILYKQSGEVKGFEFIGVQLDRIEGKIDKLFEADKALTPEERQAKNDEIIKDYLDSQIKGYPISNIVGEIYPSDKFFVDRNIERRNLPDWLMNGEKIVVIKGVSGDGKTALMTEVLREIAPDDSIVNDKVKGILTFYFRDFSGKILDVNLLDICKKADARLKKDNVNLAFALQYEEFRKKNPLDIPVQIIAGLCHALNSLGDIWFIFDNFESALKNGRIKDAEIEAFIPSALAQNHLRILITSQVLPVIPGVNGIRQCTIADLPSDYAKEFLWSKGRALKENGTDCGLAEATSEQFDELFTKLLPSPISLISFIAYLETLCDTEGNIFADVLADETLFVGFAGFDADDKNKGARVLIRRQFELLSEIEQLVLKALSIFQKGIEFPVLQSILPLSLEKSALLSVLKSNSLVRKGGKNLYELLPLPKEVIANQLEQSETLAHKAFNLKAAIFYRSIHKPVADCYTLEDFDTYFKEIEHSYQAGIYEFIVRVINEIMPKTTPLGMMKETLERSKKIQDKLDDQPEAKADNHINIGISLDNLGRLADAVIEYDKAIEIRKDLVENQGREESANSLASAFVNKGIVLDNLGRLDEAITEYDKAIEIRKDLVEKNKHTNLANDLARAFLNKGNALFGSGKLSEAIAEYDKTIEIWEDLVENQSRPELANELAMAYDNKGNGLQLQGKLSESIAERDKAIGIWEKLVVGLGRKELANDLAMAYMNKGNVLEEQNNSDEAVAIFGQAIEVWEKDFQLGFVHTVPNLAKALRIRVSSLIKVEDWENITTDAIKSLSLMTSFMQGENLSEHFKQQIGGEFGLLLYQIKQLSNDNQEKIYTIADEIGRMNEEAIPFGEVLRSFIGQI